MREGAILDFRENISGKESLRTILTRSVYENSRSFKKIIKFF